MLLFDVLLLLLDELLLEDLGLTIDVESLLRHVLKLGLSVVVVHGLFKVLEVCGVAVLIGRLLLRVGLVEGKVQLHGLWVPCLGPSFAERVGCARVFLLQVIHLAVEVGKHCVIWYVGLLIVIVGGSH